MQPNDGKALVSRFLLEGLGEGKTAVVDQVFAEGHILRSPVLGTGEVEGTDFIKGAIEEFWSGGASVRCTIRRQIAEGDRVATSYALSEEDREHVGVMVSRVASGKIQSSLVVASEVSEPEMERVQRRRVFN